MELTRAVGETLKRIRKSKKLSMERLAAEAGVSRSMLGQIARGAATPSGGVRGKLAGALKGPAEVLLENDDCEPLLLLRELDNKAARLEGGGVLIGWQGGRAVPLAAEDILRCYGEEKGVKCQTPGGVYDLKARLYELEGRLDRHTFVRISHSEIISLRKITALDLSLTGTIRVTLEGGAVSYVSRRYVRKIKEALGL